MAEREDADGGPFRYWQFKEFRSTMTSKEVEQLEGEHPAGKLEFPDEVVFVARSERRPRRTTKECYSARTEIQGCSCPA